MSDTSKSLPVKTTAAVPTSVPLGQSTQLDLSWVPEDERKELLMSYARGQLDISRRANELGVEVSTLRATLNTLSDTTRQVAQDGNSVTVTHTQNSQFGRTEIIMGNTDTAVKGKLTKSQAGQQDWSPYYILAAIAAVVLIAIAAFGHH
jgi:hypothetical protein